MKIEASDRTWTVLSIIAIGVLALIAGFDLIYPKPHATVTAQQSKQKEKQLLDQITAQKITVASIQRNNAQLLWTNADGTPAAADKIAAQSLDALTAMSAKRGVTLLGFRPQKANLVGGIVQQPYMVTFDGSYPGVVGVLSDLEGSLHKLAVSVVQVSSADPATDRVNANIGVVAYTLPTQAEVNAAKKQ